MIVTFLRLQPLFITLHVFTLRGISQRKVIQMSTHRDQRITSAWRLTPAPPRCFHVRPARTSPPRGHWRVVAKPSWKKYDPRSGPKRKGSSSKHPFQVVCQFRSGFDFRKTHNGPEGFFCYKKNSCRNSLPFSNERLSKKGVGNIFLVGGWTNPFVEKICDRQNGKHLRHFSSPPFWSPS